MSLWNRVFITEAEEEDHPVHGHETFSRVWNKAEHNSHEESPPRAHYSDGTPHEDYIPLERLKRAHRAGLITYWGRGDHDYEWGKLDPAHKDYHKHLKQQR